MDEEARTAVAGGAGAGVGLAVGQLAPVDGTLAIVLAGLAGATVALLLFRALGTTASA